MLKHIMLVFNTVSLCIGLTFPISTISALRNLITLGHVSWEGLRMRSEKCSYSFLFSYQFDQE